MDNSDQNIVCGFYKSTLQNNEIRFDRAGDECFVFAQGYGKNAKTSAAEVCETAILAHRVLRNKQFYFEARLRLLKQQYNIVIRKLLRIGKLKKFIPQTSLTLIDCSDWSYWINTIGEDRVFLFRQGSLTRLIPKNLPDQQQPTIVLKRTQTVGLQTTLGEHHAGDVFIIINKNLGLTVNEKKLASMLNSATIDKTPLDVLAKNIIQEAKKRRANASLAVFVAQVLRDNPK